MINKVANIERAATALEDAALAQLQKAVSDLADVQSGKMAAAKGADPAAVQMLNDVERGKAKAALLKPTD